MSMDRLNSNGSENHVKTGPPIKTIKEHPNWKELHRAYSSSFMSNEIVQKNDLQSREAHETTEDVTGGGKYTFDNYKKDQDVVLVNKPSVSWKHYLLRCQSKWSNNGEEMVKKERKKCYHYSACGWSFDGYKLSRNRRSLKRTSKRDEHDDSGSFARNRSLSIEDFRVFDHGIGVSEEVENEYCEEKSVSITSSPSVRSPQIMSPAEPRSPTSPIRSLIAKTKREKYFYIKTSFSRK